MFLARCAARSCYRAVFIHKQQSQCVAFSAACNKYARSKSLDGASDRTNENAQELQRLLRVAASVLCQKINVALDADWEAFKTTYGKKYRNSTEENIRRSVWEGNVMVVEEHNARHMKGEFSYTLRINKYSDLTSYEIAETMTGYSNATAPGPGPHFTETSF